MSQSAAYAATVRSKWAGELIFIGEALIGEPIGVVETDNGDWLVRHADVELGHIHLLRRRPSPRPLRGVNRPMDLMEIAAAIPTGPTTSTTLMLNGPRCHPSIRLHRGVLPRSRVRI